MDDGRYSMSAIREMYPDRWVALSDCEMDGVMVVSATVKAVCRDEERLEKEKELDSKRISFIWCRTTEPEGASVLFHS